MTQLLTFSQVCRKLKYEPNKARKLMKEQRVLPPTGNYYVVIMGVTHVLYDPAGHQYKKLVEIIYSVWPTFMKESQSSNG